MNLKQSKEDYRKAAATLKDGNQDIVGVIGKSGAAVVGGAAGYGLAGTAATACGASTFLGSASVGAWISWLGLPIVLATPVGWVIGCTIAGAAVGGAVAVAVASGAKNDKCAEELAELIDPDKE